MNHPHPPTGYDLIGDIHCYADPLVRLLDKLGYAEQDGVWRHPTREVVFLGDFIDRGPHQREVIDVVRPMIEAGAALAVMGNHELNALAFHTPHPHIGEPLRPWSKKNRDQHDAFITAYAAARTRCARRSTGSARCRCGWTWVRSG